MRNLTASALTKIADNLGGEPINIIEVEWVQNSGTRSTYADRDIAGISGRILNVESLDNVINVLANSDSQEISVTLNDTDGAIRAIMDVNDIHARNVWVYQWFEGLSLSDKFLLFKGKINSPVIWRESDRTVSFAILSQLEDREIGFSPEEGNFPDISPSLIGKPWPMCFGTTLHSKTVRLTGRVNGVLGDGFGIADFALPHRKNALETILAYQFACDIGINQPDSACYAIRLAREHSPLNEQIAQLDADYICQVRTQRDSFRVFEGEAFPRGIISLKIGSAILEGYFVGSTNTFMLTHTGFNYKHNHPEWENFGSIAPSSSRRIWTRRWITVPPVCTLNSDEDRNKIFPYPEVIEFTDIADHYTGRVFGDNAGYVYLRSGARVELSIVESQKYVVSIVPGTVLKVSAWARREGQRFLQDVPGDYYTVTTETFGTISAVIITLNDALSKYEDMGWEDEIYVTFQSDVGPNTVDILEYLIQLYTDFAIDNTTFNAVKAKIENYPSHFAIYDRKNILNVLQEIAWQACCSIYLKDDIFYIQYLPEEPTPVATISRADIETESLELFHTDTEDIVTKLVCEWRASGVQEDPHKVILRHNVIKYGTHAQTFDYYIYNYSDAVVKSATFWMIRYSNTWKKIRFKTPLTKLNLETLDPITLSLIGVVANQDVISIIEEASYDSEDRSLIFECWTPVKAGEMEPYIFSYPANVDSIEKFPTDEEVALNFDGSGFDTNQKSTGAIISMPQLPTWETLPEPGKEDPYNMETKDEGEDLDRRKNDRGNPTPSNIGDIKPEWIYPAAQFLSDDQRGPESKDLAGMSNYGPDGYGNDYPTGPRSGLDPSDIDDPGHEDAWSPNDLPDPDDLDMPECSFQVIVWYVDPVTHVRTGDTGAGTREEGAVGNIVNGALTSNAQRERYFFSSCEDALAFKEGIEAYAQSATAVVGQKHPYMVVIRVGAANVPSCPHPGCADPPEGGEMIAFRPNGSAGGSGYSDYQAWAGENGYSDGSPLS